MEKLTKKVHQKVEKNFLEDKFRHNDSTKILKKKINTSVITPMKKHFIENLNDTRS